MQPQPLRLPHSGLTVPRDGWTVTATTEAEACDSLLLAWHEPAAEPGADPDLPRRDALKVRHGVTSAA